ncbi:HBR221Wp [Eremothecium sinecaudum]|uniref:mitogen-activated protein kinase kinase n=1 Tax=Eremothecium sinecaudum TaxID=45286 RepID=A0A109UXH2_9SACH|nr:HBR221Wp [Eremothecium sinecaudum]AMD19122.1 HBR221Wp [Eremothecium sinecaudum]
MDRNSLQRSGSIHSGSSASKNYSNLNANLHARVKAFQEQRKLKRSGSVGSKTSNPPQDASSIQHIVNKPLPPLPGNKIIQPQKSQSKEKLPEGVTSQLETIRQSETEDGTQLQNEFSTVHETHESKKLVEQNEQDSNLNMAQDVQEQLQPHTEQPQGVGESRDSEVSEQGSEQASTKSDDEHEELEDERLLGEERSMPGEFSGEGNSQISDQTAESSQQQSHRAIGSYSAMKLLQLQQRLQQQRFSTPQQRARFSSEVPKQGLPTLNNFQGQFNPIRRAPRAPESSSPRAHPIPNQGAIAGVQGPARPNNSINPCEPNITAKPKLSLSARRGMKLPPGSMNLKTKQQPQEFASQPSNKNTSALPNAIPALPVHRNSKSNPGSLTNGIQTTSTSSEKQVDTEGTEPSKTNSGSNSNGGLFAMFSKYVDIKSGSLNFTGKLSLSSQGVDFSNGSSFRITLDELKFMEELGHGNYGTVSKVLHKPTNVMMAMKEVRLELDESKFNQILMELEVLHKCQSPYIVDFYGAFFIEGAVYMCMELMDGGSLDKTYDHEELGGVEEPQLAFITESVIRGLKELKDVHNVIHRDVKPTNILCSAVQGSVKLCDFGVSGNLVASLAKTNIGCQSYMAPERIKSLNPDMATYSVQSDIWSLGLSIVEMATGAYPYPPETYDNIFSQLSAIVDGPPPRLPADRFSSEAQDFVSMCLQKIPERRPTYGALLEHPWLKNYDRANVNMNEFISTRLAKRQYMEKNRETDVQKVVPALHMGGLMS